jgi:valyl-tRNA synthetase
MTVTTSEPEACAECGSTELERDPDVLDTWFSSALWPFATLGWPDDTPDLRRYYPGDFNITAREIIRLWENRMIFSGLELVGDIPFRDVIIHSTVLAVDGRRMSKSLGTGIDPIEPIEEYGADATRYGLSKISSTQDVRFSYGAIEEGRKLAIKLWNVARLILQSAEGIEPAVAPESLEERWILARLDAARAELEDAWARFDFSESTATLYHLTFDDFCDWYAEAVKPRLYDRDEAAIATALAALERLTALLHPVLPHVTEEIWSQLPAREARLIVSPWPGEDARFAADAGALERVQEAAQIFRRSGVQVELGSDDERRIFAAVVRPERALGDGNRAAELERLRKEVARAEGMLANERFTANAPAEVVAAEREKLERYRRELAALEG